MPRSRRALLFVVFGCFCLSQSTCDVFYGVKRLNLFMGCLLNSNVGVKVDGF